MTQALLGSGVPLNVSNPEVISAVSFRASNAGTLLSMLHACKSTSSCYSINISTLLISGLCGSQNLQNKGYVNNEGFTVTELIESSNAVPIPVNHSKYSN